jgi:hypothetical protein
MQYRGVTQLLSALGPIAKELTWRLDLTEVAPGPTAAALESLRQDQWLTTQELDRLAGGDAQIIDGAIFGHRMANDDRVVVVITAVDSTSWDVESTDEQVIQLIRAEYPDAITFD